MRLVVTINRSDIQAADKDIWRCPVHRAVENALGQGHGYHIAATTSSVSLRKGRECLHAVLPPEIVAFQVAWDNEQNPEPPSPFTLNFEVSR